MGSAIFYLKARYPSNAVARAAADQALPYFEDIEKMERHWHKIRTVWERPPKERFKTLMQDHPMAAEFVRQNFSASEMDPNMNFLSHEIPDVEPGVVDFDLVVIGDVLYLKSWAWQHSDWDPIAHWLEKHGATKVKWASSQDLGIEPGPKDWKPRGIATPFDRIQV